MIILIMVVMIKSQIYFIREVFVALTYYDMRNINTVIAHTVLNIASFVEVKVIQGPSLLQVT